MEHLFFGTLAIVFFFLGVYTGSIWILGLAMGTSAIAFAVWVAVAPPSVAAASLFFAFFFFASLIALVKEIMTPKWKRSRWGW